MRIKDLAFTGIRFTAGYSLLVTGLLVVGTTTAKAELWKCVTKGSDQPPIFTETPSFGDEIDCVSVSGGRFSRPGQGGEPPKVSKKESADKKKKKKDSKELSKTPKATKQKLKSK